MRCNVIFLSLGVWGLGGFNNQYTLPKTNMGPLFFWGEGGGGGCGLSASSGIAQPFWTFIHMRNGFSIMI